jgi:hypothetical protein
MGDHPFQLNTDYFSLDFEAMGFGSIGLGWRGHSPGPTTGDDVLRVVDPLAGAGGRVCFNWMRPTNEDQATGAYSGYGVSICNAVLYNYGMSFSQFDHGYQVRPGARFFFFTHDGRLRIPLGLDYIYRYVPEQRVEGSPEPIPATAQHGAIINVGVHYYFRGLNAGPGVNPYIGADFNIGGIGGNDYGGLILGLTGGAGIEGRF